MLVQHISVGAVGRQVLVVDDRDRYDLLARLGEWLGDDLLAFCLMCTHLHVIAEGAGPPAADRVRGALRAYARAFHRRHRRAGRRFLRGDVVPLPRTDPFELMRTIRYLHANPTQTKPPLATRPVQYRWSSQRAFDGLRCSTLANVERTNALLGRSLAQELTTGGLERADLRPALSPTVLADRILEVAAEVHGVPPWEVRQRTRTPAATRARALFVRLGRLEGYRVAQLAPVLGRSRSRTSEILLENPVDDADLQIARSLLRLVTRVPAGAVHP